MSIPTENTNSASIPPKYDTPTAGMDSNEKNIPSQGPPQAVPQNQPQGNNYPTATPLASLQQVPAPVDCPVCGVREMTTVEFKAGGMTHVWAALFCLCLCLGCIPYMAKWFKNCEHKCGNCGAVLAVWHRSGRTEVVAPRAGQMV